MLQGGRQPGDETIEAEPLEHEERAVGGAPDDEGPAGAVPQPAQEEDDHQVDVGAGRR